MHELGLVNYVIKEVNKIAKENNLTQVSTVTLEFGEVSGIIPEYLVDYWKWAAAKDELLKNTEMKYEMIPAVTWCNNCKKTYPTIQYGKTCPYCGSGETWLQKGNEMNIKEIEAC